MRKISSLLMTTALVTSLIVTPALAQEGHWHGDIHHFHEYDYDHWRGGNWYHGFHDGRDGWWWTLDGGWYYYPAPIYPYPDPYTPPMVVTEPIPVSPPGAPPAYVYYCPNPNGYYPYVAHCYGAWQRVASEAEVAPHAPPPHALPMGGQREIDDRQLNAYAGEFQNINLSSHHARSKLKVLEQQVEAFRQALYSRDYNAMDILHDAEGLQHRIEAQREALAHGSTVMTPPPEAQPSTMTSPGSPPPGMMQQPPPSMPGSSPPQ